MKRLIYFLPIAVALLLGSCVEMMGSQRVALEIPERQNWSGVELFGDIERIEVRSYELLGYFGYDYKGELLNQTTTEFNLRGDVVNTTSIDDQMLESLSYSYDADGRLVGKIASFGGSLDEHRYTLDKYGCIVVDELYGDGGELESVVKIDYDSAGNDVQHRAINRLGNTTFVQSRAYDEAGHCVEVVFTDGEEQVRSRETTSYDSEGRKIEVVTYEGYDIVKSRAEYLYGDGEVLCTTYDEVGAFVSKVGERYNDNDLVVESVTYDADDVVMVRVVTEYDEQGRVTLVRQSGGNDELQTLKLYEYDDNGSLVKFTEEDKLSPSLSVILYSYDEHKNLVNERCYMGKYLVAQYVTEYDITYREAGAATTEELSKEQI
jgi:hypothetical protein